MAFARVAAVAGAGTVSCTGTTTVTGVGTNFGAAGSTARLNGTITVGGVTKTITAIASTTSLTTDTAFGTFTGQAYTGSKEVLQTGADTMGTALGVIAGFTVTNRGDQQRTFDIGGVDLTINGTLTVDCVTGQLRNNSFNNALKVLSTASASAELIFTGRKVSANNGPFPYDGLNWLGTNGSKIMQLQGTAAYPAKLTLKDACIRYGADWITTNAGQYSEIKTEGEVCWILNGHGTGTGQARLRMDNTTATVNFTAKKTYVGVWLNFGVPQISLKGYTPLNTDGPEVNMNSVSVAQRIPIEDYDTTYVVPNYYANSQIVLYGGAWVRLINNLKGTNMNYYSQNASASAENILEFSRRIVGTAQDSAGNLLSDGTLYYQPVGSNVTNIRPKGVTTDVTFNLAQQVATFTAGSATSEFVYAWGYDASGGVRTAYNYFCTGQTKGAETHTVYSSRYGYDKQPSLVTLAGNGDAEPTFVHASLPTTDKVIANAAALSGVAFNFTTKTMTITGNNTIQTVYDQYQYQLNQTANLGVADDCLTTNERANYVGWTIVVNTGVTLSEGGNFTSIQANTITLNGTGKITAIYATPAGTSTTWEFQELALGNDSACAVWDSSGNTLLYVRNPASATQRLYLPPGSTLGTLTYGVAYYGKRFEYGTFPANAGGVLFYVPDYQDDVGITEPTLATVEAYTAIDTSSKFYDRAGAFKLTEQGIKLGDIAVRSGTAIETGSYSILVKQNASSVFGVVGSLITIKSTSFAGDSKYLSIIATAPATVTADTNEVITIDIEDANGNSSVTLNGGDGTFELWKIPTSIATNDYATGTLLDTVGNEKYRFIGITGFDMVGVDINSNIRRRISMAKGVYTMAFYVGDQIQLAQAPQVIENGIKLDVLQVDLDALIADIEAIKGSGFTTLKNSLVSLRKHVTNSNQL